MSKSSKNWWKLMKIATIHREILLIFCTTRGILMNFSGKMWLITQFVRGFQPPPSFSGTHHLTQLAPLFKIFVSPLIFSVPLLFKVFEIVSLTLTQPLPALIRPTNLPWFKQISKGWFYQFNCCFLSKINF